jgi:hypothetical protein
LTLTLLFHDPVISLKLGQGQWVVTANIGNEVKFSGPYKSQELAFEAAKEKFGAIRFMSAPNII